MEGMGEEEEREQNARVDTDCSNLQRVILFLTSEELGARKLIRTRLPGFSL
jgi:hypothetical protein